MRLSLAVIVLMVISFVAGYWIEHRRAADAQRNAAAVSSELSNAKATIHLYQLQDQLLALSMQTASKNYGDAATLSTKFFDDLRQTATRTPQTDVKSELESVLDQRDAVTAALARGEPNAHELLVQLLDSFRQILTKLNPG